MEVHIFKGAGRVFACTEDPTGANLPVQHGPWELFKTIELIKGGPAVPGLDVDDCISDIETYGFHATEAHVRITESLI